MTEVGVAPGAHDLGPDHPEVVRSLDDLAEVYLDQGRYDLAEPLYKRTLADAEKAYGSYHSEVAARLRKLAGMYDSQGRYAEAEPLHKRALAIKEEAVGSNHPSVAATLNNLAEMYDSKGQYALAEPLYKRSLAIWEKVLGPEHMDVVLVACKRDVVEDYQFVLHEAGLEAKCVDCSVFALENAAELTNEYKSAREPSSDGEQAEAHALVNIGANMMNINVLIDGRMAFVRDQFFGGHNLTVEIQKQHSISYHAAEQMKFESFSEIHPDALERFYVGLTSELIRSLDFYSTNHAEYPVRKLLLSGGCALIPDIVRELEQRLGIDALVLNPFTGINVPARKFDADNLSRIGPMLMVPVGLALRGFDS